MWTNWKVGLKPSWPLLSKSAFTSSELFLIFFKLNDNSSLLYLNSSDLEWFVVDFFFNLFKMSLKHLHSMRLYDWNFVSEKEKYLIFILLNRKSRAERKWKEEKQRRRERKKQVRTSVFTDVGRCPTFSSGLNWK